MTMMPVAMMTMPPNHLANPASSTTSSQAVVNNNASSKLHTGGKVRRSISCYHLPSIGGVEGATLSPEEERDREEEDSSMADENEDPDAETRRELYETLRAKKESVDQLLQAKLAELKALCLKEAVSVDMPAVCNIFTAKKM